MPRCHAAKYIKTNHIIQKIELICCLSYHADLLVGVSSVDHGGARQVVVPPGGHGQSMTAHQRSCDQLDNLKVLLQVLDNALLGCGNGKKSYYSMFSLDLLF